MSIVPIKQLRKNINLTMLIHSKKWSKKIKASCFLIFTSLSLVFYSTGAFANVGLPMIAVVWPALWLAFIPIVAIEAFVYRKYLPTVSLLRIITFTSGSNFFSTLIGIPLTWGGLLLIQFLLPGGTGTYPHFSNFWKILLGVTVQAPWLVITKPWAISIACMVLFIPFYFVSAWVESIIVTLFLPKLDQKLVTKTTWRANLASYAFLYVIAICYLIFTLINAHLLR